MRGLKIPTMKKISINEVVEFRKPKHVYIPLICGNDTDITIKVKVGNYIYKGDIVGNNKGKIKRFIHSSVSGKLKSIENKVLLDGTSVKCLIIENDFKEQMTEIKGVKKNIRDYSKKEFIEIIKKAGVVGMGGAGFPTYVKYDTTEKIKLLIVSAVECEPYLTVDYMNLKTKIKDILEAIDAIMEINKIDKCIIGVQKHNKELIKFINQYTGTYLNIEVKAVPDLYPMGWERSLIKATTGISYDKLPIEKNIIVNNITTIYSIYKVLKTGLPVLERVITLSGEGFKKPTNILVKIGTPIEEILEEFKLKKEELVLIGGGPMMGSNFPSTNTMVTKELSAVVALPPLDRIETSCIRCGKCINVCPAGLYPVLIKDCRFNKRKLEKLNIDKCVNCGLCSYICPARIDLRQIVKDSKEIMKGED